MLQNETSPEHQLSGGEWSSAEQAPGIYLIPAKDLNAQGYHTFGSHRVCAKGRLSSHARRAGWTLFMDGLLIQRPSNYTTDAGLALDVFLDKGIYALRELQGFFNILILSTDGEQLYAVSDLLCSRPWYIYRNNSEVAAAPTPTAFAAAGLPMTMNRQALYEQIRLLHTGYDRTLVKEVQRVLPGHAYRFSSKGLEEKIVLWQFHQNVDHSLSLDECASWVTDLCSQAISGVLTHPTLKNLPVQLPLTGGLDSRHILGELIAQGRTPELLRHVRIQEADYKPVKEIADDLGIPLLAPQLDELNTKQLLKRWSMRSGGLVNVHQYYLLHLKNALPGAPAISFNGYLMDILVGMAAKTSKINPDAPHKSVWNRTYSGPLIRRLLIPGEKYWAKETEQLFLDEISRYKGEPWFRMLVLDIHHRGLHYTGIIDTMLSDEVFSFSPGAGAEAFRFMSAAPHGIAGDKKARLHALRQYFPHLAAFPGTEGRSFSEMNARPEIINNPLLKNARLLFNSLRTGFHEDPAPETEHAWLRQNKDLHQIHKTVVYDSALVKDGYLYEKGLKTSWNLHKKGGYQAWMLMSVLSAEVAYRILVKKHPPDSVISWLYNSRQADGS